MADRDRWYFHAPAPLVDGTRYSIEQLGEMFGSQPQFLDVVLHGAKHTKDVRRRATFLAGLTESDTLANFASSIGDVRTIIYALCLVVLTTVLLIAANSMTMLVRDRVSEVAVMRALGFMRRHVAVLLLSEAVLIAFAG